MRSTSAPVLRRFASVDLHPTDEDLSVGTPDLGRAAAPDETTILRFRRLLEQHKLCGQILDTVNHDLVSRGMEWPFRILKRVFGFTKVRYRGLKKNHQWLLAAFALVNLYQHRKRLAPLGA